MRALEGGFAEVARIIHGHPTLSEAVMEAGARGRRLADPRLRQRSPRRLERRPLLLRPRKPAGVPRVRAGPAAGARPGGVAAGARARAAWRERATGVRCDARSARSATRSRAARRSSACSRCAGRARSRSTARWRCAWPPTRSRSAARSRSRRRPSARRSPAGAPEQLDFVLIAAAACEMHPRAVLPGAELRAVDRAARGGDGRGARRACRRPAVRVAARDAAGRAVPRRAALEEAARPDARSRARRAAVKANRAYQLIVTRAGRTPALLADAGAWTTSRSSTSTAARWCCSGTARRTRPRGWRARCATTSRCSRPRSSSRAGVPWIADGRHLPEPDIAREWLATMTLIRRFEERAGEMYARAKVGGFLHLSIGEEATIVGSARALREQRLPDLHLPLARPRARARHAAGERDGRAVRPRRRLLARARRLDAHVRPRAPLHGRLRDRRRQPADRRGHRAGQRLQGARRGHAVHVRRRRLQPGHVRRDAEPGGAVAAAGRVHGHQQPVRHGHRAPPPLGGDRPAAQGREPRRARDALRRDGRARHPRGRVRGGAPRARGPPAAARRGGHLPLPRALDGRSRGVPLEGGGGALARARPDPGVRRAADRARA